MYSQNSPRPPKRQKPNSTNVVNTNFWPYQNQEHAATSLAFEKVMQSARDKNKAQSVTTTSPTRALKSRDTVQRVIVACRKLSAEAIERRRHAEDVAAEANRARNYEISSQKWRHYLGPLSRFN